MGGDRRHEADEVDEAGERNMEREKIERKRIRLGLYRHFKGGLYEVADTVIDSESLGTMVLYRPQGTEDWWVRPYDMFMGTVERDGIVYKRFTFIG